MKRLLYILPLLFMGLAACKTKKSAVYFLSPEQGSSISQGKALTLKLAVQNTSFDSVTYLLDSTIIASRQDTNSVTVPTKDVNPGIRLVTARIYNDGKINEITTNVVILSATAPIKYSYQVINTFPHDTASFTEGLEYHDGVLYESEGMYGESSVRKADLKTGKVLQRTDLAPRFFGEGLTVIGDKIIQLTYKEGVGFVYDKNTLKQLSEFPYQAGQEGWGLCFDGKRILNTDGTNMIHFLNKDTYQVEGGIAVYDDKGPVDQLNELEMVDGMIYANIWQKNIIVIINPETGVVEGEIDFSDLYPESNRNPEADVFNGIAWDAQQRRLFVTGKKWNKLFEVKINKQ